VKKSEKAREKREKREEEGAVTKNRTGTETGISVRKQGRRKGGEERIEGKEEGR